MQTESASSSPAGRVLRFFWHRLRVASIVFVLVVAISILGGAITPGAVLGAAILGLFFQSCFWVVGKLFRRSQPELVKRKYSVSAVPKSAKAAPVKRTAKAPSSSSTPKVLAKPESPKRGGAQAQPAASPARDDAKWIPPGSTIEIHGVKIPHGMIYVGGRMKAASGWGEEPALINPQLPVKRRSKSDLALELPYWPKYSELSAEARSEYLVWLSAGRRTPGAPDGFVFLFFYGLERRLLVDIRNDPQLAHEVPILRAEVAELLEVYGGQRGSIRSYLGAYIDLIDAFAQTQNPVLTPDPSSISESGWELPFTLRVGVSQFAAQQQPLPSDWALAWARLNPQYPLRTPAIRCQDLYDRLFATRYAASFGDGMRLPRVGSAISLAYRPASSGLSEVSVKISGLKDITGNAGVTDRLRTFASGISDELDAYSRLLGRQPDAANSIAAIALLPDDLVNDSQPLIAAVTKWADARLGSEPYASVPGRDLLAVTGLSAEGKLSKADAARLGQFLDRCRLGFEPDARFGRQGPTAAEPVVLFRLPEDFVQTASPEYEAAALLLHLASAVSGADGSVAESELDAMEHHLEHSLNLGPGEQTRLRAHLRWLVVQPLKLTGLQKRVASLAPIDRERIAAVAVALAAADGTVTPAEVRVLERIYRLLALPEANVPRDLHNLLAGARHARAGRDPVVVRPAVPYDEGELVPQRPPAALPSSGVTLNAEILQATLRDSHDVAMLLRDIFVDPEPEPTDEITFIPEHGTVDLPAQVQDVEVIQGLDAAHSRLVREMAGHSTMSYVEYEQLADSLGVMPGGALDLVNELSLDVMGDYVIEQDDDGNLVIVFDVMQELVA